MSHAFVFDTGHTWADFLATRTNVHGPAPSEWLTTAQAARNWFDAAGLGPAQPPQEADLPLIHAAREALRTTILTRLGYPLPPLSPDLASATALLRQVAHAASDPVGAPESWSVALTRIVVSSTVDLAQPASRFLTCAEHVCSKVFSDRGDVRQRYCSSRCATRARVRSHRVKRTTDDG
ncbi:ABATE domain-containing protein [Amycolatopsis sp. WQ 127309]|uniref:ABATE domain-containing protein n=1 Tax=Amycolatopsis sp. WQ 127309 TaxID=2932773 RepID=UPI001FF28422|nr:ABATE domain-containing protein [Amycolatopsis sp. WQ 127309]UOZ05611.1 CGNR zinc finger domain-containing protein [Amycolatopsis sp. WQ 127309]